MNIDKVESVLRALKYKRRQRGTSEPQERLFKKGEITISLIPHDNPGTSRFVIYETEPKFQVREAGLRAHTFDAGLEIERYAIICWWDTHVFELLEALRQAGVRDCVDALRIGGLGLSIRSQNTLLNAGFDKVGDFHHKTAAELMSLRNFSKRVIREVQKKMLKRGLDLGWHV